MTLLLYPSVGFGQGSGHDRAAEGIYDSRDRQAETKSVIEALLGVYLVHPPRRHQSERVRSEGPFHRGPLASGRGFDRSRAENPSCSMAVLRSYPICQRRASSLQ